MTKDMGVPASPSGHSSKTEPSCTVSAQSASVPNAEVVFRKMWAAMNLRAKLRGEWLRSMPEGHPMRVLATLQNTASCFVTRQSEADRVDMLKAIEAAKEIEDEAFSQWRQSPGSKLVGENTAKLVVSSGGGQEPDQRQETAK